MLKECNVWSFLVASVLTAGTIYVVHETVSNDKYPVFEFNHDTGDYKFYINDQASEIETDKTSQLN